MALITLSLHPMIENTSICLIREGKVPPDRRVAFDPLQCEEMQRTMPIQVFVQSSLHRCFPDEEYIAKGIEVTANPAEADYYFGIKEVPIGQLIPGKTYFFFSHTIKKQPHNRILLQAVLEKKITLIDYELLTDDNGQRLAAFGYYAGVVGAHNSIYAWGKRTGLIHLPRMKHLLDYAEARAVYHALRLPDCKVVVTGTGRVGKGVVRVLKDMGFQEVSANAFLAGNLTGAVFTVLIPEDYIIREDGAPFSKAAFYSHPEGHRTNFAPYTSVADVFINAILWKPGGPAFFTMEDIKKTDFNIQTIGDITCDLAPITSVPTTIKASTIDHPVFGIDRITGQETPPFLPGSIDMMTIDNLPSELPRDASASFGAQLLEWVLPELLVPDSKMLYRATIARNGALMPAFAYLEDYVNGG